MIYLGLLLLAVIVLAPLALALRGATAPRGRRESALAVHRAQLVELDRDLAQGGLGAAEHAQAVLEVQRRLLAAADLPDEAARSGGNGPLILALVLVPLASIGLYLIDGHPELPAEPLQARREAAARAGRETEVLVAELRQRLAQLDPGSETARQGFILLGNAEASLDHAGPAAKAWRKALAVRFDPMLAMEAAEAQSQADGRVTADSAALFRRALADAPPDAPWRGLAERRLAQFAK